MQSPEFLVSGCSSQTLSKNKPKKSSSGSSSESWCSAAAAQSLFLLTSDPSCTDPMPIYAELTKGRHLFAGQSSSHVQDESSLDGLPARRSSDSKVDLYSVLCVSK